MFFLCGSVIGKFFEFNMFIVIFGIYECYFEVDGKIYYYILDLKIGYLFDNDIVGVLIVFKKLIDGDGLFIVIFFKGVKGGMDYIE